MHETRTIAEWAVGLSLSEIPEEVKAHARRFILDNFGCLVAGATLSWSKDYREVITRNALAMGRRWPITAIALHPMTQPFSTAPSIMPTRLTIRI